MADPVPCNYCGVDDATIVFPAGVAQISQIVRCNRCGLMYASPRAKDPDHMEIGREDPNYDPFKLALQAEADGTLNQHFLDAVGWTHMRLSKERLQVRDYDRTRALLNRLYPNRGKLLEVGSSLGFLLDAFRKDGWDVLGVEPAAACCKFCKDHLGIEAIPAILEDANIPDESIDVLLFNHVIEHVDDPIRTLGEINRVLKPGGHLVIETPRYDTLMFKLMGRRERSVNCGGHIYFFTFDTLRKVYEAAGFDTVEAAAVGRSLSAERLLHNVGIVSKSRGLQRAFWGLSQRLNLDKLKFSLNLRDMQRVCVRKVAPARCERELVESGK
ncbi:class I SAM-dependent methyltransferase [Aquisphaera insulae]|uniref:class I SAM-dependent methyltransferase n=1 Tax=Aquisphaera insulae TaxID=2712864 RepID=UPI0013EAC51F|nr:class I SAM-dependent methyltransferase [Aquisphaera insulae]